jgi:hypothetical protein
MREIRFFDPLYGRIEFSGREAELIFAPEIQRLRYVRMCNINSMLISGASEISRFEHIIGVLHLARIWSDTNGLTGSDGEAFHAAALLHDVQTGPFGHSMEYVLADNRIANEKGEFRHDDVLNGSRTLYLQRAEAAASFMGYRFSAQETLGPLWAKVADIIAGKGSLGPLIAGRVDLDNIDNVVRLAYHVGVADRADARVAEGLARDLRIQDSVVSISRAGADLLSRWQEIRRDLYRLLLHDWAEFSAKAMLSVMMEQAVNHNILGAESWLLTDDQLMARLTTVTIGETQEVAELGKRLIAGQLYVPLGLWFTRDVDCYAALSQADEKREIERDLARITGTRVIFHVIRDKGKTERALYLQLRDDGKLHTFGVDTDEVLIGVFLSREIPPLTMRRGEERLRQLLALRGARVLNPLQDPVLLAPQGNRPDAQLELL